MSSAEKHPGAVSGAAVLALAMLALIFAQLIWWLIFFSRNQSEHAELQKELDRWMLAAANSPAGDYLDRSQLEFVNGAYRIPAQIHQQRESEHQRRRMMMLSETSFVLAVFSYGTFRVVRAIRRERLLNHERSVFVESVTHELKTPLASILLNLQTMQKRSLSEERTAELIKDSILEVRRLEEQVNNILLSRRLGRSGGAQATRSVFSARAELEAYLAERQLRAGDRAQVVQLDGPADLRLYMNPDDFRKLAANLIENAFQYAGPAPAVRAALSATGTGRRARLRLRVSDNGPGIPPAERENVFKPFYRLQKSERPVQGSGLGLYLVRELAEAAGGEAFLAESASGLGATFEVRLPLYQGGSQS